ncbi:MAG: type II toxin-antitoxin system RelE/ParE family toxin [DPANN group archaeon]|nr:type II toxin-antitoxin system RelE/ParE family toxin [DPANN group archaeon]
MTWKIEFTKEALRDISKLETKILDRILDKLEQTRENPHHYFQRLVGHDDFKFRVGDYRILVLLLHDEKIIIQKVGHRKNVYKRL